MFSFHKPRVYRSTEGCCICRAKSSSSRFTDSKKYEDDSVKCFNLEKPRQGEICNACVLLVKRFKRLPVGSNRHWGHVVDARIGPGIKSLSKFKKLREECQQQRSGSASSENGKVMCSKISTVSEKFCKIFRKNKKKKLVEKEFDVKRDDNSSDDNSSHGTSESLNSDDEMNCRKSRRRLSGIRRRKCKKPVKLSRRALDSVGFFDENDWKMISFCCGTVFENNKIGALIVDNEKFKPCPDHVNSFYSVLTKVSSSTLVDVKCEKIESSTSFSYAYPAPVNKTNIMKLSKGNASPGNVEFIATPNSIVYNTSVAALKKHQIFYKRQSETLSSLEDVKMAETSESVLYKNDITKGGLQGISPASLNRHIVKSPLSGKNKHSFLHKIKADRIQKTAGALTDTNKPVDIADPLKAPSNQNGNLSGLQPTPENGVTTKFSDNSSDSGFDENLPDQNACQVDTKEKKILIRPIESLFISSTVPMTLPAPPGSQTPTIQAHKTVHAPQNVALLSNHKVRAIYNTTPEGGLTCVPIPSNSALTSSIVPPSTSTSANVTMAHKKFLYIKSKQNSERPPNN